MARLPVDHRNSLTASAVVVDLSKPVEVKRQAAARREWQETAWTYYRKLPEVRYPANFVGASLGRFRLRIAKIDPENPNAAPVVLEDEDKDENDRLADDVLADLKGSAGGHSAMLKQYGICMNVSADGWLVGEPKIGDDGEPTTDWEFLSTDELQFHEHRGSLRAFRDRTGEGIDPTREDQLLPADTFTRRFWRPSAQFSSRADGALESLSADCERLIALNDSITSRILNRLAQAGILFIPNGINVPIIPDAANPTPDGMNPVIHRLLAYFEAAIINRGSAAGAMPIPMVGPPDLGNLIKHITLDRGIDETELQLRSETRDTIARGQDLPPEVQSGLKDASHWTSWSVMDSSFRNHLMPLAETFATGVTRVYLRPALMTEAVGMDAATAGLYVVIADGAEVVARPNEAEDARQLHDRVVIDDTALRRRSGVPESDAPDEDDLVRQLGRKMNNPYLATWGLDVHEEVDWDKVAAVGQSAQRPGVGSTPEDKRSADSSDPAGAPGEGDAGGTSNGQIRE